MSKSLSLLSPQLLCYKRGPAGVSVKLLRGKSLSWTFGFTITASCSSWFCSVLVAVQVKTSSADFYWTFSCSYDRVVGLGWCSRASLIVPAVGRPLAGDGLLVKGTPSFSSIGHFILHQSCTPGALRVPSTGREEPHWAFSLEILVSPSLLFSRWLKQVTWCGSQ